MMLSVERQGVAGKKRIMRRGKGKVRAISHFESDRFISASLSYDDPSACDEFRSWVSVSGIWITCCIGAACGTCCAGCTMGTGGLTITVMRWQVC